MKWWLLAFITLASLFLCVAQDQRKQKGALLNVVEFKAARREDTILLDGKFKNDGENAIRNAVLVIHFMGPGKQVVATRKADLDATDIEPGEETEISLETPFPARAISIRLECQTRLERWIELTRNGPFPIE
ncbi:hypothetical protein [uncultured Paludibaculum sp.]|uniref:hypothetical protein n=1 Tax=uncultured Paludibaculum sp. TaxID=1765020 RepID=UPI002AABAFDA|nr:hypothetical protein [uncultured Paludibaculum sp.]